MADKGFFCKSNKRTKQWNEHIKLGNEFTDRLVTLHAQWCRCRVYFE